MRLIISGAAGFIGSRLVDRYLADGHNVTSPVDYSNEPIATIRANSRGAELMAQLALQ